MKHSFQVLSAVLCLAFASAESMAVTLSAIDSGFVTSAGGSDKFDALATPLAKYNYSVGWELHYPGGGLMPSTPLIEMDRKNYFVFDLAGVTSPVTSASIEIYTGGYTGDATETFVLAGTSLTAGALATLDTGSSLPLVPMPPGTQYLVPPSLVGDATLFYSLLTGSLDGGVPAFGTAVLSAASAGTTITIALTPDAVSYLNGHLGGTVVFGGKSISIVDGPGVDPQTYFEGTGPATLSSTKLILATAAVPLPATWPMFLTGLLWLGTRFRPRAAR